MLLVETAVTVEAQHTAACGRLQILLITHCLRCIEPHSHLAGHVAEALMVPCDEGSENLTTGKAWWPAFRLAGLRPP